MGPDQTKRQGMDVEEKINERQNLVQVKTERSLINIKGHDIPCHNFLFLYIFI